jgi:hypothetical protein
MDLKAASDEERVLALLQKDLRQTPRPEKGKASLWFLSIVSHQAIDVARCLSFGKQWIALNWINFEPHYPDVWQQVDAELVEALPEEQKEVGMLAYFGGLAHLNTVKGRLRLAMQKLRGVLQT